VVYRFLFLTSDCALPKPLWLCCCAPALKDQTAVLVDIAEQLVVTVRYLSRCSSIAAHQHLGDQTAVLADIAKRMTVVLLHPTSICGLSLSFFDL
jgi:hypothetical protein